MNFETDDGYPTDETLRAITDWDAIKNPHGLMEFIRPYWEIYGSMKRRGSVYRLATGGWSGNEDIIDAMHAGPMMIFWESSRRGRLHVYDVLK